MSHCLFQTITVSHDHVLSHPFWSHYVWNIKLFISTLFIFEFSHNNNCSAPEVTKFIHLFFILKFLFPHMQNSLLLHVSIKRSHYESVWIFLLLCSETFLNKLLNKALVTETLTGGNVGKSYDCLCNLDFNFAEALTKY